MKKKFTSLEKKWILYDVGNSAFTLLASTVIPIYFNGIAGTGGISETDAVAYWGYAASLVTLIVAVLGPVLGTFADYGGWKRPMFFGAAMLGVLGCAALAIPLQWTLFLALYVVVKIAYSTSLVFYDSMLTDITDRTRMDNVSSHGYAWGYIGSCIPFIISIVLINFSPLSISVSMPIAFALNAVWWLAMTLPLFFGYKQKHFVARQPHAVKAAFKRLFSVFKTEKKHKKGIILFLIAFFLYIDGVYTIIDMATTFGTALGFETEQLLLALLLTQIIAFPSAILFGYLAPRVSNDRLILVCICAYAAVALFAVQMDKVWEFWFLAVCVGLFQGGIQALSRSYFAKIVPADKSGEYFGIMDIFGKGAAFVGTMLVSVVTQLTDSVNMGVIPIACLFIAGLIVFIFASKTIRKENAALLAEPADAPAETPAETPAENPAENSATGTEVFSQNGAAATKDENDLSDPKI